MSVVSSLFPILLPLTSILDFFLVAFNHAITSPSLGGGSTLAPGLIPAPSCIRLPFTAKMFTHLNTSKHFVCLFTRLTFHSLLHPWKDTYDTSVLPKLPLLSSQVTLKTLHSVSKQKVASYSASTPVTVNQYLSAPPLVASVTAHLPGFLLPLWTRLPSFRVSLFSLLSLEFFLP